MRPLTKVALLFIGATLVVGCSSTAPAGSTPKAARGSPSAVTRSPAAPAKTLASVTEVPPGLRMLPSSGVGPATFAYGCGSVSPYDTGVACGHWRLLTRDGALWYLPEALGDYWDGVEDDTAPLAISPDGLRVAYFQAHDGQLVVRELASGAITPMRYTPTWDAGRNYPTELKFLGAGWLLVSDVVLAEVDEKGEQRGHHKVKEMIAKVTTGEIREAPEGVIGVDETGTRFTTETATDTGVRLQTTGGPAHHIVVRQLNNELTLEGFIAKDGLAFDLAPRGFAVCGDGDIRPDKLVTVDLRTGKNRSVVTPKLPKDVGRGWGIGWLNPREVLVGVIRNQPGDDTIEETYALDILTGDARRTGRIDRERLQARDPGLIPDGEEAVGGYLETSPDRAARKKTVPLKRGSCG
ncbi:hypothetical protein [Rhizohabitans arisaemae]|uniref:hypothetical protein n=1 Tax=Rhizohabitans arisaemae TaxID=2720610 RepID=UPI0024B0F324|nr:hypothetical protein [Rhizohabitans arisaemae]